MQRHLLTPIRAALRGLDPDSAQDCYQDFHLQKLLDDGFRAKLNLIPEDQRDPWLATCAYNFARTWRRASLRQRSRNCELDPAHQWEDRRCRVEADVLRRCQRDFVLEQARAHAGEILAALTTSGMAKRWAGKLVAAARRRGLTDFQALIAVCCVSWRCGPRKPAAGRAHRGRRDVYASRVRERLLRLVPYLHGERPWPSTPQALRGVMFVRRRALLG
ncbi:MAG: hypothetical protein LAP87_18435 [Acidobacteriia bacterium]|nr:hypothetical protein [Terriglobia bacterium]